MVSVSVRGRVIKGSYENKVQVCVCVFVCVCLQINIKNLKNIER